MAKTKRKVAMPAGIRNKMMAAVSMLMVSAIMMVSSTYAWFTLSTAPEVKNISTTVAGNGSLEIALMPKDGLVGSIKSGFSSTTSGGTVAVPEANITWGNLIDLSHESYGLAALTLNPAKLNEDATTGKLDKVNPLVIPIFGYDGRVDSEEAATVLKICEGGAFSADGYGVRAIGEFDGTKLGSTYGYAIDLAFRLNAANNAGTTSTAGKLLLQTEPKQRIYNGETTSNNAATAGNGSYMSFNANNTGIDLVSLMQSIRVTFIQNYGLSEAGLDTMVLGTAKLDHENVVQGATETTAKLYLYDTAGTKLTDNNAVLVPALEKGTAAQVTALVWLDGTNITNASVSAIKGALAQATLNLQFSTDVVLKPASNNALIEGSAE